MSSAIELLKHFVNITDDINKKMNEIGSFKYSHSISATKDCHTIEIHTIDELDEICGFFIATASIKSDQITFHSEYGDIDYGLHACVDIDGKRYTFNSYLQSVLGITIDYPTNVREIHKIDEHSKNLLSFISKSYPLFIKDKKAHIKEMTRLKKIEQKKDQEQARRSDAQTAIRRANIHFIEGEYDLAYKIYKKNKEFLTKPDALKMDHCKKFKKQTA